MSFMFNEESPIARILALVEFHCPRLIKEGGGGLCREVPPTHRAYRPRFTAEEKARIVSLLDPRKNMVEIAAEAGCSINTVRRFAKDHKVTLATGVRGLPKGHKKGVSR